MKKSAIFVEGQTEQIFIERLLIEVFGASQVTIQLDAATGGKHTPLRYIQMKVTPATETVPKWFFLIVDCGADNRVKSDIRRRYDTLVTEGYSQIIGIRDVFPDFSRSNIPSLLRNLQYGMPTSPVRVFFPLATMEIEAWFLAEYSHFEKINSILTVGFIKTMFGIDLVQDDLESIVNPANDMNRIYRQGGKAYHKKRDQVQATIDVLDYATLFIETRKRMPVLGQLIDELDRFATS